MMRTERTSDLARSQIRDLRIQANKLAQRVVDALERVSQAQRSEVVDRCIQGRFSQAARAHAWPITELLEAVLPEHSRVTYKRVGIKQSRIEIDITIPLRPGVNVAVVCSVYGNATNAATRMAA